MNYLIVMISLPILYWFFTEVRIYNTRRKITKSFGKMFRGIK